MKHEKVTVTERALFARINRVIAKENSILCRCREDSRDFFTLGRYYVIDTKVNCIFRKQVDLEGFGREKKVLKPFERLADAD